MITWMAYVLAAVVDDDDYSLRASATTIRVAIEQALAMRGGVRAEQLALGIVPAGGWSRLADGAAALTSRAFTVKVDDDVYGAVIQSGSVSWCLGLGRTSSSKCLSSPAPSPLRRSMSDVPLPCFDEP